MGGSALLGAEQGLPVPMSSISSGVFIDSNQLLLLLLLLLLYITIKANFHN